MVNKVILIGNLGADPDVRYLDSGSKAASFSLATTERRKGKDGQVTEHTEWHRVVAWNRLAEICGEYLSKGSKVYVEGKLQTRKWKDQSGADRYTTEIVAWEMKFLSPRRDGTTQQGSGSGAGEYGYGGDPFPEPPPVGDDVPF